MRHDFRKTKKGTGEAKTETKTEQLWVWGGETKRYRAGIRASTPVSFLSSLPVTMATCKQPVRAGRCLFPFLLRLKTLTDWAPTERRKFCRAVSRPKVVQPEWKENITLAQIQKPKHTALKKYSHPWNPEQHIKVFLLLLLKTFTTKISEK